MCRPCPVSVCLYARARVGRALVLLFCLAHNTSHTTTTPLRSHHAVERVTASGRFPGIIIIIIYTSDHPPRTPKCSQRCGRFVGSLRYPRVFIPLCRCPRAVPQTNACASVCIMCNVFHMCVCSDVGGSVYMIYLYSAQYLSEVHAHLKC